MNDISNLSDTIVPKSDQLNADDLLGGPLTITVSAVHRGSGADQPLVLNYDGDNGRPFKPCKTVRKLLIFAWGDDGREWIGRSMTIYNDPSVMYGGVKVGGIRVSHLSHIDREITVSLTSTRGKKTPVTVKRLAVQQPAPAPAPDADALRLNIAAAATRGMDELRAAWGALSKDEQRALGKAFLDEMKVVASHANAAHVAQNETNAAETETDESIF